MNDDFDPLLTPEKELLLSAKEEIKTRRTSASTPFLVAIALLILLLLTALFGPLFSPYTFEGISLPDKNLPPSAEHLFGTDELGRDLFTRVCMGLRLSLTIGLIASLVDVLIGVSWGITAGFVGGTLDHLMMRVAEMIYSLPYILFAILVTVIIGPGIAPVISAMVLIGWIQMARITRNLVIQIKHTEFFTAAFTLGVGPFGLIRRHILPNISGPIAAVVMLTIPSAIFAEAFLSFLGIGIQPPMASLGSLVSDSLGSMRYYPWRLFFPSCMITLTIFAFNMLGDSLRDLLDPHQRKTLVRSHAKSHS